MKLIMRHDPFSLDPVSSVYDLRRDMSRLFDFAFPGFGRPFRGVTPSAFGNVDLYRVGEKFVLRAELPGVAKEQIGVDVVEGKLVLSVSTPTETEKPAVPATAATTVSTEKSGEQSDSKCQGECDCASTGATSEAEAGKCEAQYTRTFKLPVEVDNEKISARYENGVLTVELPQREEIKPRSVSIQVS